MSELQTKNNQPEIITNISNPEEVDYNLLKFLDTDGKDSYKTEQVDFTENRVDTELNHIEQYSEQIVDSLSNIASTNNINNNSLLVPKENMDHFFGRLQSASKLKIIKAENISISENKQESKLIHDSTILNENKINYNIIIPNSNKANNSANTLKNTKNMNFTNYRPSTTRGARDTIILDQKLNVLEVLNDRNNLLITESNENYTDSSREENTDKYNDNVNPQLKPNSNKNINDFNFRKFEEGLNLSENYPTYDNFILSNKREVTNEKILTLNELGRKVNSIATNALNKISTNSQNFTSNNKKSIPNAGNSRHSKITRSTDMSSMKTSMNSESISGSTSSKITPKIKNKVGSVNPPIKGSLMGKNLPVLNRNLDASIKNNILKSKTPTRNLTPVVSRTSNTINNPNKKVYLTSNTSTNTSKIIINKNNISMNELKLKTTLSNKKQDSNSTYSTNKNRYETITPPFKNQMTDEYDYSKILVELKSIFGEDLENFDENLLFANLDEFSNKGMIKGLIMLSHMQFKKIKLLEQMTTSVRSDCNIKLKEKDESIKKLEDEMTIFKSSLRGLMGEVKTEKSIYQPKSNITIHKLETRNSFRNSTTNK